MHVGGFQALSGASRLQGPPGTSRGLHPTAAYCQSLKLEFHAGWSGWTRPPTMAGGAGAVWPARGVSAGE